MSDKPFNCLHCPKSFAKRSLANRHQRRCEQPSVCAPRRKSCRQCVAAKARCDLHRPVCSRCMARGVQCVYTSADVVTHGEGKEPAGESQLTESAADASTSRSPNPASTACEGADTVWPALEHGSLDLTADPRSSSHGQTLLHGSEVAHVPPVDASGLLTTTKDDTSAYKNQALAVLDLSPLRDRWLNNVLFLSDKTCTPNKASVHFYGQILRTYPRIISQKDQLPPVVHPWQILANPIPVPLANCITLVRMWQVRAEGAEQLVVDSIRSEIGRLLDDYRSYGELDLLAAIQALLIYSILAFFSSNGSFESLVNEATIMNIQQVAYHSATIGSGLVTKAEKEHTRPTWEEWIIVSAKRRTNLALYCFDCVFTSANNLPTFPCDELRSLPAPESKALWQCQSEEQWKSAYSRWLVEWDTGIFTMGELMRKPRGDSVGDERRQMWLSEVDEFGLMMAVVVDGAWKGR